MKRTKEHNRKIGKALKGKPKSLIHKIKMSESAKKRLALPENNPNYRGDKVGYIGIHIWLRKKFGYPIACDDCGLLGEKVNNKWTVVYALKKGKKYERNRDSFITLCNKHHRNYDKTDNWNKNISKSKSKIKAEA